MERLNGMAGRWQRAPVQGGGVEDPRPAHSLRAPRRLPTDRRQGRQAARPLPRPRRAGVRRPARFQGPARRRRRRRDAAVSRRRARGQAPQQGSTTSRPGRRNGSPPHKRTLSRSSRAYSKRVPRTNCTLRIKKCAPRISSWHLFLSTNYLTNNVVFNLFALTCCYFG